jgi:hypothetical protein
MLFMQLAFFYIVIESRRKDRFPSLPYWMWAFGLIYCVAHVYYRFVVVFHVLFGLSLAPCLIFPLVYCRHDRQVQKMLLASFLCISISFLGWVCNNPA